MDQKFFELVKAALPDNVAPQDLIKLAPQKWWSDKPYLATAYALRKCPHLDWNAYLDSYPDVKESGTDGCLHFLRHGVYEGRKLIAAGNGVISSEASAPLVSIVMINFNNAHLLPKTLESVTGQTLKNIEIIVVDDASTDRSRDIIREYANRDQRIRLIVNEKNSATLIARKRGVEAATGCFLMLLDSDDFLAPHACEVAANAISKGYDMVKFGANVINSLGAPQDEVNLCDEWCNRGDAREYYNEEIVTSIFRDGKMSWFVWSCICRLDLAKLALAELPDEYITGPDDVYALLAIARRAASLLKIKDRLYFYNYGPGVSVSVEKDKLVRYAPARAAAIKAIERFAAKYSPNIDIEVLYQNLSDDLLTKFLLISDRHDVSDIFNQLAQTLGFKAVMHGMYRRRSRALDMMANLVRPLKSAVSIHRIGIYAPELHHDGMESAILALCEILRMHNYEVTLLLGKRSSRDARYSKFVKIVYIGAFVDKYSCFSTRFLNLAEALDTGIDMMLYFQTEDSSPAPLLWDTLTLHHYNIPVIIWPEGNFASSMSGSNPESRILQEKLFRNAEAVICQSDMEELYLRARGVNAVAIHAPVAQKQFSQRNEVSAKIALMGVLGLPRMQILESLKVLREVARKASRISLCLIGDFLTNEQTEKFREKVRQFGLEKRVTITGWAEKPEFFLKECSILLSVSACESMAHSISEAQALGLPCVIYDIPIDQTHGNPSIISVPQLDYEAAATAILSLLENDSKWRRLSEAAVEHSRNYALKSFADKIIQFLKTFQYFSPFKIYSSRDYTDIVNYMSYYGGRRLSQEV